MTARRMLSKLPARQLRYVQPVFDPAPGTVTADVYDQVEQDLRVVIPPVLLHSPAPDVLAAYWALMRETLHAAGTVPRRDKEIVAAAVSVANICPYCADMHSIGMYDLSTEHEAEAIVRDRIDELDDDRLRRHAAWARAAHTPDVSTGAPPFPEDHRPELVGVVVAFHYLTRMVNVFLSNFLLPPRLAPAARRRLKHGISRILAPTLRADREPGLSVPLLPDAALTGSAAWAAGSPVVAAAVARAYAAFEAAGERSVPDPVRALVGRRLAGWRGEETGLSRQWCEDLIAELPARERAAGRVALLTALASYQVDEDVIGEFRNGCPDDRVLVETAAWASFAAARRIGEWHVPAYARTPDAQSETNTPADARAC